MLSYVLNCDRLSVNNISMATVGLCVIKKSARTAKLDNVFEHIFTPRIYQVLYITVLEYGFLVLS